MRKNHFLAYLLIGLMGLSVTSCNLAETNIDPTRPTDVAINLILPSMLTQSAYNQSANPARVSGIVMQYFEGVDAQQLQFTTYIIAEDAFNNFWRTGLYAGSMRDAQVIIDKAAEEGRPYYEGIAKIIMAHELAMSSSYFGDMPYTEAFQGADNLVPGYDTQEAVFQTVQTLLDEAITALNAAPSDAPPSSDDLVFGGNPSAWIATAYAFKARYAMMLSNQDGEAATKALTALGNAFTSADGQPNFAWGSSQTSNNPLAKFGIERPGTLGASASFVDAMLDREDPRFSSSFSVVEVDSVDDEGELVLDENDNPIVVDTSAFNWYAGTPSSLTWSQDVSVIPMISYAELKFIEAEALARTGGSDADILAALVAGVTASMQMNGVAADDYADYVDALEVSGTTEEKIETIMGEAYFAYYGHAIQVAWANYRRTGYPELTPNADGANGLNPSGVVPRRFLYPVSEAQLNADKLSEAETRQDNNGDGYLLDDNMWIFQ